MTSEELALVREVLSRPDDNTPYLLLADWLDEHEQAKRAEFLRLQIEWRRLVFRHDPDLYQWEYLPRLTELSQDPLLQPLRTAYPIYYRGVIPWLVSEARFNSWSDFENHAAVRFSSFAHSFWKVHFDCGRLRRWQPKYVRRLVTAPAMAYVLDLDLRMIRTESAGALAIAESPLLVNLTRLDLQSCSIDDTGAMALARSPYLSGLQFLNLDGNPLIQEGRSALEDRFGNALRLARRE